MYNRQKVISLALTQVGYHEQGNNLTKYAQELDRIPGFYNGPKNGYAWCDVFVDWLFVKAYGVVGAKELLCQPDNSCGAGCLFSANYFKAKGRFFRNNPQPGDQIFFSYQEGEVSHTGLVVEVSSYGVITVEGNTSDMVAKRSYALSDARIFGYGRPDWSAGTADPESVHAETEPQQEEGPVDEAPQQDLPTAALPIVRRGEKSETVRAIQGILIARDCSCGRWGADGEFGNDTRAAVLTFQRRNGLDADGDVEPITWAALLGLN